VALSQEDGIILRELYSPVINKWFKKQIKMGLKYRTLSCQNGGMVIFSITASEKPLFLRKG